MFNRLAVLVCVGSLCLPSVPARAEEHKTEHKTEKKEEKKEEKKAEAKHDAPKAAEHKAEAKHEAPKPAAKAETHEEAKPSPVAARPAPARRTSPLARPVARTAARTPARPAAPKPAAAAAPKPTPVPVVVEVKQEPARVEAILHVVPYGGQAPSVAPFAGAGNYAAALNAPSFAATVIPAQMTAPAEHASAEHSEEPHPAETTVAPFAPPVQYAPPGPRNALRTPKNALTNEGLVLLAQVGYDEDFILDLMRRKNCRFDTSVEGLAYMATHGLTERIIRAALEAEADLGLAARR